MAVSYIGSYGDSDPGWEEIWFQDSSNYIVSRYLNGFTTVAGMSSGGLMIGNDTTSIGYLPFAQRPLHDIPFLIGNRATQGDGYGLVLKSGEIRLYDTFANTSYWEFCVTFPAG